MKATGTTLGADNGIGAAAILAVLDADDLVHGPLELLFTVDEETGLTGVLDLDPEALAPPGAAAAEPRLRGGGLGDHRLRRRLDQPPRPAPGDGAGAGRDRFPGGAGSPGSRAATRGWRSTSSAATPSKLLARVLFAAAQQTPFHLAAFQGGNKHNALPREASARVVVPAASREAFAGRRRAGDRRHRGRDPHGRPGREARRSPRRRLPTASGPSPPSRRALDLLNALPHGVLAMSYDIPGLVETSTNLATVAQRRTARSPILMSIRSSVASAMRATEAPPPRLRRAGRRRGRGDRGLPRLEARPRLAPPRPLPAGPPRAVTGEDPEVLAIHAGLECGVLREKFPGMDTISFGPVIQRRPLAGREGAGDSVGRFWGLLKAVLGELAG